MLAECAKSEDTITRLHTWPAIWQLLHSFNKGVKKTPDSSLMPPHWFCLVYNWLRFPKSNTIERWNFTLTVTVNSQNKVFTVLHVFTVYAEDYIQIDTQGDDFGYQLLFPSSNFGQSCQKLYKVFILVRIHKNEQFLHWPFFFFFFVGFYLKLYT